jgi:hypothetical protein
VRHNPNLKRTVLVQQQRMSGAQRANFGVSSVAQIQQRVFQAVFQHANEGTHGNSSYLRPTHQIV